MKYITFLLLLISLSCNSIEWDRPKGNERIYRDNANLEFRNKIFDFGKVNQDTLLSAKYYFSNISDDSLIIYYVNPDCICTEYSISNDTIMPGDSAFIKLTLNTSNKSGEQKIYSTVCANTKTRMYCLILKANVSEKR